MEYDFNKIVSFAMIDVKEKDIPYYKEEIDKMLKKIATLPPVEGEFKRTNLDDVMELREDVVCPSLKPEEALANSPKTEAGCFVVPRFLD